MSERLLKVDNPLIGTKPDLYLEFVVRALLGLFSSGYDGLFFNGYDCNTEMAELCGKICHRNLKYAFECF